MDDPRLDEHVLVLALTELGGYGLVEELGRGSNAVVYLVRREGVERPFALKLLLPTDEQKAETEAIDRELTELERTIHAWQLRDLVFTFHGGEPTVLGAEWIEPSATFDNAHVDGNLVTAPAWPAHAN